MPSIQAPIGDKSIANLSRKVIATLSALSKKINDFQDNETGYGDDFTLESEIDRFRLWVQEQGADHGQLDHRLRESSMLRLRVLASLEKLSSKHEALLERETS